MDAVKIVLLFLCGAALVTANYHNLKNSDNEDGYRRLSESDRSADTNDDFLIAKLRQLVDVLKAKLERNNEATKRLEDTHLEEAHQKKETSEPSEENAAESPEDTEKLARMKKLLQRLAEKMDTKEGDVSESKETQPSERNFGPHGQELQVHEKLATRNFGPAGQDNLHSVNKKENYDLETKSSEGDVHELQERRNFGPHGLVDADNAEGGYQAKEKRNFGLFGRSLREMIDEELEKVMKKRGMK